MTSGLASARADLEKFGESARKVGADITRKFTLPIVAAAGFAVDAASDQAEAQSAVNTVYGKSAKSIEKWSKTTASAMGISRTAALSAAVTYAGLGKAGGLAGDDLVNFSKDLVQASSDLGSFYNVDPGQVLQDLRSGLAGEAEPLRKYNIFLTEADVAQKAMLMSGKANADQLTSGEKILARQALIMEGLGDANGDFARTSEGMANSLRIAKAELIDAAAVIGTILMPYVTAAAQKFAELAERFQTLSPRTQKFILIAAGILAVLGPVIYLVGALSTALVFLLSPIGLVIIAIALLYLAYRKNFLGLGKAFDKFLKRFMVGVNQLLYGFRLIKKAFDAGGLKGAIDELFGKGGEIIMRGLGKMLGAIPRFIGDFLTGLKTGFEPLDNLIHAIGKVFTDVGLLIQHIFQGEWSKAFDSAKDLLFDFINQYMAIGALLLGIFNAIPWTAIGTALLNGARAAFSAIVDAIRDVDWGDVAMTLVAKGADLLAGFLSGAQGYWDDTLKPWLIDIGISALAAIPDLADTLLKKGKDLLTGLWDGAMVIFGVGSGETVTGWIKAIPTRALESIGDLILTLYDKGVDLIKGLWSGIEDKFDDIISWLDGLDNTILGWLPWNLGSILYDVGYDIVVGMKNGLYAGAHLVTDAVNYLVGLIPGPIKSILGIGSPSKLMRDLMFAVPQGIALGLADGRSLVSSAANSLAMASIPGASGSWSYAGMGSIAGGSSNGNGGNTIYGGLTVNVNGAGDADVVADRVTAKIVRAFTLKEGS